MALRKVEEQPQWPVLREPVERALVEQLRFICQQYGWTINQLIALFESGAIGGGVTLPTGNKAEGTVVLSGGTWHPVPNPVPSVPYRLWYAIEAETGIIRKSHSSSGSPSATDGLRPLAVHMIDMAANQSFFFGSDEATDRVNWITQEHE